MSIGVPCNKTKCHMRAKQSQQAASSQIASKRLYLLPFFLRPLTDFFDATGTTATERSIRSGSTLTPFPKSSLPSSSSLLVSLRSLPSASLSVRRPSVGSLELAGGYPRDEDGYAPLPGNERRTEEYMISGGPETWRRPEAYCSGIGGGVPDEVWYSKGST